MLVPGTRDHGLSPGQRSHRRAHPGRPHGRRRDHERRQGHPGPRPGGHVQAGDHHFVLRLARALAPPSGAQLRDEGVPLLPRWISQFNRFITGIEIHPGARIGHGLFIDHGSGVVIGETTEIGDNVTIYQGVTLGGTGKESGKRHPTVGDNVIFGAGAKVLGAVTVGDNAKVGAGSVVVSNVPKNSTVVGNPGRPVLLRGEKVGIPDIDYRHLPDPVAEAIKCLVARIVEMEKELDEIHPERSGQRQQAVRETQAMLAELLKFDEGAGI